MGRLPGHRYGVEAKDLLLSVVEKFETNPRILYHLARYCCGLGQVDEAKQWLAKALLVAADIEEVERVRRMALEDPDLGPLWKGIGNA